MTEQPVTLRQLLRLVDQPFERITDDERLDREVHDVVVAQAGAANVIPRGALVVAAYRRSAGFEAELLLRKAETGDAAGVVLTGAGPLMLSTRRLAERVRLPLFTLPAADPVRVAWQLAVHVHDPQRFAATLVPKLMRRLRAPIGRADELIEVVDTELGATSAVFSADGAVLAGQPPEHLPEGLFDRPMPRRADVPDGHLLATPVYVEDVRHPALWLVAKIPPSHPGWAEASLQATATASLTLANWLLRQRLVDERDARDRSTLLSELLDTAPAMPRYVAERVLRAGWRLDGWHVGIHLRVCGDPSAIVRLTGRVGAALRDNGLSGPVVERSDGWACWITEHREPPTSSHRDVLAKVAKAIAVVEEGGDGVELAGGVGRPYAGPAGVSATLKEAREACLFAGTGRKRRRAEHVDELGVRRVLADWYHAEAFLSYARTLLAPLLEAGDEHLLETLRTYLESESSASSTAAALRVHRNTVTYRIGRIEQLLSMSLARADERLVLQLACRVLQDGATG